MSDAAGLFDLTGRGIGNGAISERTHVLRWLDDRPSRRSGKATAIHAEEHVHRAFAPVAT